jgi:hypothetical protein
LGKVMEGWTTIATTKDTQERLSKKKIVKAPGKMENYNDVIRREMNMPEEGDTT